MNSGSRVASMSEHATEADAHDLFDRYGRDVLGPWAAQSESVRQAWRKLADQLVHNRARSSSSTAC